MLPLQNVGRRLAIDFLRLALPDEIATRLSHTRGLAVRPFSTTSQYEQAGLDLRKRAERCKRTAS